MISVVQLGCIDYATGLRLQQTLVDLRLARKIGNLVLLLQHTPVITFGRNANRCNLLASPEALEQEGVEVFECDRGGDVTYHGPGQLVGYPIFDLRSFPRIESSGLQPAIERKTLGVVDYVRRLEEVLIRTCADFGVAVERVPKLTGVWTKSTPQAKLAAIGVHIARGVTSHGFALNVNTDLERFKLIVPCGISSKPVTSLAKETGAELCFDSVAQLVARHFGRVFQSQILWLETLDELLGRSVGVPLKVPEELRKMREEDRFQV